MYYLPTLTTEAVISMRQTCLLVAVLVFGHVAACSPSIREGYPKTSWGMTPEQVERLFEPFTSTTGGTGLGLSIVYQIIRDHSGTINVRSRLGEGTTITIELPVTQ